MQETFEKLYETKKNEAHFIEFIEAYAELYEKFSRQCAQLIKKYEKFPYPTDFNIQPFVLFQEQSYEYSHKELHELSFKLERRRKDIHEQVRLYEQAYERLSKTQKDYSEKLAKEKNEQKMKELNDKLQESCQELKDYTQNNQASISSLLNQTQQLVQEIPMLLNQNLDNIHEALQTGFKAAEEQFALAPKEELITLFTDMSGVAEAGIAPVLK